MSYWFGVMELPFLFIAVLFAFLTAYALKGGKFGKGMTFMAWGFLVMAIGHLHMQIEHYYGINIFKTVLGQLSGSVAWFVALIVTWGLVAKRLQRLVPVAEQVVLAMDNSLRSVT